VIVCLFFFFCFSAPCFFCVCFTDGSSEIYAAFDESIATLTEKNALLQREAFICKHEMKKMAAALCDVNENIDWNATLAAQQAEFARLMAENYGYDTGNNGNESEKQASLAPTIDYNDNTDDDDEDPPLPNAQLDLAAIEIENDTLEALLHPDLGMFSSYSPPRDVSPCPPTFSPLYHSPPIPNLPIPGSPLSVIVSPSHTVAPREESTPPPDLIPVEPAVEPEPRVIQRRSHTPVYVRHDGLPAFGQGQRLRRSQRLAGVRARGAGKVIDID